MKIAVLIPCYNESKTIAKVVADYRAALPEADIYVYDNNSTDHTDEIARQAGAIVRYEYRQGKGNVIRTMFREIVMKIIFLFAFIGINVPNTASAPARTNISAIFTVPLPLGLT